ncbi:MAG: LolA family protein [Gemmobacter sp.]|uniref:LolA family protein n=1 Tax=Gemmobacter sp. TaxID=1898957 RepID=UPI003919F555
MRSMRILALVAPALAPVLVALAALPAQAEKLPLAELSRYLNGLSTAEAEFTQINPDGTLATGTIRINRPGKVRFEYAPPDRTVVMADGQQVAIFDPKSNQPPEQYPLRRTPLHLILAPTVDLGAARMVVGHAEEGPATRVTAQDPDHPEYGRIDLIFTPGPTELRQWVITDDAGNRTTMILGEMKKGTALPARLFDIGAEAKARGIPVSDR